MGIQAIAEDSNKEIKKGRKKKRIRRRSRRSEWRDQNDSEIVMGSEKFPVFEPLAEAGKVDVIVGKNEQVCVIHDTKLDYVLKWVEFDELTKSLTLISQQGQLQPLGLEVPKEMYEYLMDIDDIAVIRKEDKKIQDIYIVSFIYVDDLYNREPIKK